MEELLKKELRGFLDPEGRLRQFPAKRQKQQLVLRYLAQRITPGRMYTEQEINETLNGWHLFGDHCLLRRELWNHHYLERKADGSRYWLTDEKEWPLLSKS